MASATFLNCSSLPTTSRLLHFNRMRSGVLRLQQSSASLPMKPRNPNIRRSIISTQRRSSYSATAALTTETSAKVIDGKAIAKEISDEIGSEIFRMKDVMGLVPGLAVILVGDRKDSATFVYNKKKACEAVGITFFEVRLPEDSTEEELFEYISKYNDNPSVHGILIQQPLPSHMDEKKILNAVKIEKHVDGFHPINIGRLGTRGGKEPTFVPCTPKGCIELLNRYDISIKGKKAVVIVATLLDCQLHYSFRGRMLPSV